MAATQSNQSRQVDSSGVIFRPGDPWVLLAKLLPPSLLPVPGATHGAEWPWTAGEEGDATVQTRTARFRLRHGVGRANPCSAELYGAATSPHPSRSTAEPMRRPTRRAKNWEAHHTTAERRGSLPVRARCRHPLARYLAVRSRLMTDADVNAHRSHMFGALHPL